MFPTNLKFGQTLNEDSIWRPFIPYFWQNLLVVPLEASIGYSWEQEKEEEKVAHSVPPLSPLPISHSPHPTLHPVFTAEI